MAVGGHLKYLSLIQVLPTDCLLKCLICGPRSVQCPEITLSQNIAVIGGSTAALVWLPFTSILNKEIHTRILKLLKLNSSISFNVENIFFPFDRFIAGKVGYMKYLPE